MSFYPAKGGGKAEKKYLYKAGDECTALTGGWKVYPYTTASGWKVITTITKNSDNLYLVTSDNQIVSVGPVNKIDLTNVDFIQIESEEIGSMANSPELNIFDVASGLFWNNPNGVIAKYSATTTKKTRIIDVSNITGEHYIAICTYNGGKTKINSVSMK